MKYLMSLAVIALLFVACKKDQDLGNINETIYVRNGGADMPVHVHGNLKSNVIVLIVHGGPGGSGLEYRGGKYAEDLEKNYAMAYWDQRGQGMSHGHFSASDITVATMVEDMNAVIKVLKAKYGEDKSIFVLGHSWGGTLSAKYMTTSDYQHNVKGWIEADGAHDIPKLNKDAIAMFKTIGAQQVALGNSVSNWNEILNWANGIDVNNITVNQGGEINSNGQKVEQWLLQDGIIQQGEQGGIQLGLLNKPSNPLTSLISGNSTSQNLLNEVEQTALTNQLNKVTIPTLILWGKYDFVVPPTLGQDTYDNISSTSKKLVIFEKSGHSPMDNEWQLFNQEVKAFVNAHK